MLDTTIFHHAIVLPPYGKNSSPLGGVCTTEGLYIENSCPNLGAGGAYKTNTMNYSDQTVVYLGWFNDVWGHTITDVLKKIWYINTDECKQLLESGAKLIYITHFSGFPRHVEEVLTMAGVNIELLHRIDQPTSFRSVIIPDDSFVSYGNNPHFTNEYIETLNRIKKNIPYCQTSPQKVYFSRTKVVPDFSWKSLWMPKDIGEKSIEDVFRKEGYKIVHPETLSVKQQISLLANCSHFAATEGSISHNTVFCKANTKVAILKKEKNKNIYTYLTNKASGADVTIIKANASYNVKSTFYGPFYLCITNQLEKHIGRRIPHSPYWLQPIWYWYMIYDTQLGKAIVKLLIISKRFKHKLL